MSQCATTIEDFFHVSWPRLVWLQRTGKTIAENQKISNFRRYLFEKIKFSTFLKNPGKPQEIKKKKMYLILFVSVN